MCARSCFVTTGVPQESSPSDRLPTASQHDVVLNSSSSSADCADWALARFFKAATGPESSGDEFEILEDERCIDTGGLPTTLIPARIGVCLQWTPVAAATDQLHYYPDSSRLVRRLGGSSVRAGSPPRSPHCWNGRVCSGEVGGATDAVEHAVFVKAASFFFRPAGLVCKCNGKE